MNKIIKMGLITSLALNGSALVAETEDENRGRLHSVKQAVGKFATSESKEISVVDKFKKMFTDGKVSGQLKSMYAGYEYKKVNETDTYATAVGATLKYELAEYNGFNAAMAFVTSQDIGGATGKVDEAKHNNELSSSAGNYTEVSEAYINYKYEKLNLRAGRQIIDTPLADSDNIRMIQNTFEAYIATYNLSDFELMAGKLESWQGIDAGLDDGWINVGEDGTWFGGVSYSEKYELNAWFYNITGSTNAAYFDVGINQDLTKNIVFHGGLQYLNESELDSSGYEADIYGVLAELVVYDIGFNFAYNYSDGKKDKQSFSGTGGGTMYTSMDTMILDEITLDRDASALVAGIAYDIGNWKLLYAYGDFSGDADSAGNKAHIVEQNMGFEYKVNEEFYVGALYVIEEDKENSIKTDNDWNRAQVMIAYNF